MKIKNNSESFKIKYNNKEHTIKKGSMEVNDDGLATFIINKARAWGLDVVKIGETVREDVATIEEVEEQDAVEETKEETKEEVKETKKSNKKK